MSDKETMTTEVWEQNAPKEPLVRVERTIEAGPSDVIVAVAACGVCHTDLGFLSGEVTPRGPRPLVAGHEISGRVVWAGPGNEKLRGAAVIVPAVWPCGDCALCRSGRGNVCPNQKMPGNDVPGGFAKHVVVPARWVTPVPPPIGDDPRRVQELAVIADAVSTPYQAAVRAELGKGDFTIVVGAGGVGGFLVQIARALGASTVIALDVDDSRLDLAQKRGATHTLNVKGISEREVRDKVRTIAKEVKAPAFGWKIFETSGTAAGQRSAYELLGPAATLLVVGYTRDKIEVMLSKLMGLDARAIGVWGCAPELYPKVLDLVLTGAIELAQFVERRSLSNVNQVLEEAKSGKHSRRVILVPDFAEEGAA